MGVGDCVNAVIVELFGISGEDEEGDEDDGERKNIMIAERRNIENNAGTMLFATGEERFFLLALETATFFLELTVGRRGVVSDGSGVDEPGGV